MNLKSFLSTVFKPFVWIEHFFTSPEAQKKAADVAHVIDSLIQMALPIVTIIATANPSFAIAPIVMETCERIGQKFEDIFNENDKAKKQGLLLNLASEVLRTKLIQDIKTLQKPIQIGSIVLNTIEDVLGLNNEYLRSATQQAYSMQDLVGNIQKIPKQVESSQVPSLDSPENPEKSAEKQQENPVSIPSTSSQIPQSESQKQAVSGLPETPSS